MWDTWRPQAWARPVWNFASSSLESGSADHHAKLTSCRRGATRRSIPARSAHKLGEEIVRWLEDRIRPDLAIAVGASMEIPLAIGGNTRLGLIEVSDLDLQPCGGTHVKRTGEIGPVVVRKIESKGRQNRRVVVALNDA